MSDVPPLGAQQDDHEDPGVEFGTRIENSTVNNLIQAGTVNHLHVNGESRITLGIAPEGGFRFDYTGSASPPGLFNLRLWLDQLLTEYEPSGGLRSRRQAHRSSERVEQFAEQIDQPPTSNEAKCQLERIVVLGISSYLSGFSPLSHDRVPQQVLLDLLVFGLWPVVTAKRLPKDWVPALSRLTSPRIAALVFNARATRGRRDGDAAIRFARAVAAQDFTTPLLMICEALSDTSSGGADLAAVAVVAGMEPLRSNKPKRILKWLLGTAIAGSATGAALHHYEAIERFVADLTDGMPLIENRNTYRSPIENGDNSSTDLSSANDGSSDGRSEGGSDSDFDGGFSSSFGSSFSFGGSRDHDSGHSSSSHDDDD